jgi:hypothetical protein
VDEVDLEVVGGYGFRVFCFRIVFIFLWDSRLFFFHFLEDKGICFYFKRNNWKNLFISIHEE